MRHGLKSHPSYGSWNAMMWRCFNPKCPEFKHYGGRGITVCKRWQDVRNFIADMGAKEKGLTIGRINNNGNYSPKNCRWETRIEQANNFRKNVFLTYKGQRKTLVNWSRFLGMNRNTLKKRYRKGWSVRKILETPVDAKMSAMSKRRKYV